MLIYRKWKNFYMNKYIYLGVQVTIGGKDGKDILNKTAKR